MAFSSTARGRRNGSTNKGEDVINPATEEPIARHAIATAGDLDEALAAAADGFERWSKVPAGERGAVLERTARLLRSDIKTGRAS